MTVREVCANLNKVSHMRDFAEDSRCPFLGVSESPAEERKSMFVTFCLPVFREAFYIHGVSCESINTPIGNKIYKEVNVKWQRLN